MSYTPRFSVHLLLYTPKFTKCYAKLAFSFEVCLISVSCCTLTICAKGWISNCDILL